MNKHSLALASVVLLLGACGGGEMTDSGPTSMDGSIEAGGADSATVDAPVAVDASSNVDANDAAQVDAPSDLDTGVDANLPDASNPGDGGFRPACQGAAEGTVCTLIGSTEPAICFGGRCAVSQCGDGFVDGRASGAGVLEECDDANDSVGDGCEPNCRYSCNVARDCADGNNCTVDACTDHRCVRTTAASGTMCGAMNRGTCSGQVCLAPGCGNGTPDVGEECDDGNSTRGDGCEPGCTFTCTTDAQCTDGNACTGIETCNTTNHRCAPGTPVVCADDGNTCTVEVCNTTSGACGVDRDMFDRDGDGVFGSYPAQSCNGTDCDDDNPDVAPGLQELCGNLRDDDCNTATSDDTQTTFYADCDGDGFASSTGTQVLSCARPTTPPACGLGAQWITRRPADGATTDCFDTNASVRPGQRAYFTNGYFNGTTTSYDYDCDATQEPQYSVLCSGCLAFACFDFGGRCLGGGYLTGTVQPACGASASLASCSAVCSPLTIAIPRLACR